MIHYERDHAQKLFQYYHLLSGKGREVCNQGRLREHMKKFIVILTMIEQEPASVSVQLLTLQEIEKKVDELEENLKSTSMPPSARRIQLLRYQQQLMNKFKKQMPGD